MSLDWPPILLALPMPGHLCYPDVEGPHGQEQEQADEAERIGSLTRRNSIDTSISTISNLADDLATIQGTFLEPGVVAPELRRDMSAVATKVREFFGGDTAESKKVIAAYDRLNKNLNNLVLDTIANHSQGLTNPQIAILQNASASTAIRPEAISDILQTLLKSREFSATLERDWELPNPERVGTIRSTLETISTPPAPARLNWGDL
mgnify:CR=1 FL=1